MILYDDKHKFLGMSSHTLSFLGYEDINDFLSMHNDFANLFVNKEGYIYNFDNFNWIDFVLYSGSANKSALIKLKNSKETKVDISIKEIHLAHDVNNMKKIYSVKILSDNFNEISNIPKAESSGFSLSGLVTKETETVQEEKTLVTQMPDETTPVEAPKNESFILNITDDELISKEEIPPALTIENEKPENAHNDFKLDFFKSEEATQEEITEEETPQEVSNEVTKESGFLLRSEDTEENPISFTQEDKETQQESKTAFEFNMLNDTKEETDTLLDTPLVSTSSEESFSLKSESHDEVKEPTIQLTDTVEEISQEKDTELTIVAPAIHESGFKLDFLKTDLIEEDKESLEEQEPVLIAKDETVTEEKETTQEEARTDNQEIIQQIKDDIKEIDGDSVEQETPVKLNLEQANLTSFEEPQTAQVEQPIEFENNTEDITQEEFSSFQMKESETNDTNNSFTDTLKGLFAGAAVASTSTALHQEQEEEKDFSFNLKSDDTTESASSLENNTPKAKQSLKDKIETLNIQEVEQKPSQDFSTSLSGLGLDADDEFNLLSDFIADTRDSIETIEQFTHTKDFDKINYALVKIKSSAEILNLNDIIDNATSMRKHCITENSEEVTAETQRLKDNISMLEKHLEATAI